MRMPSPDKLEPSQQKHVFRNQHGGQDGQYGEGGGDGGADVHPCPHL